MSLQIMLYGLVLGSILCLGAVGVSLAFGNLRFANFAHGDTMMLGAYMAHLGYVTLMLPWPIAMTIAIIITALVSIFIDQTLFRNLRKQKPVILLISSFGVALMIRSVLLIIWGPDNMVYETGIQRPIRIPELGLRIKPAHITILTGALICVALMHILLKHTKIGKAMRAVADNPDLARLTGIDSERIIMWTWAIAGGFAAVAGIFFAMDTRLNPQAGWQLLLPIFAAAIVGGIGRPYGAIAGGLIIGISMETAATFMDPAYKYAVAFGLMVLTLIFRPTGIFAGRSF